MSRSIRIGIGILALAAAMEPKPADAQILGIGPRFSMVRGDLATKTPSTRFYGGTLRLNTSKNVGFEGSLDFRTTLDPLKTQRLRETPLQGSLLIYPFRSILSPYALGGMGVYTRSLELLGPSGAISKSAQERKTGMHLGFGGELRMARHAVAYVDYRYRFVKFGDGSSSTSTSARTSTSGLAMNALLALIPGMDQLKFSHEGSMWTGGVAFVF